MSPPRSIGLNVQTACIWEVSARKLGNVHRHADFSGTCLTDFLLSAAAIAPVLAEIHPGAVGAAILAAVAATRAAVGQNTNLGIVLLLAPLCVADPIERTLGTLTIADADAVYSAIRIANPGGLGTRREQDIADPPTVTLREAMKLAADRDMIAKQYATNYADIQTFGVPSLVEAWQRTGSVEAAILTNQLEWLAYYPDSLIARKRGLDVAKSVQSEAIEVATSGGIFTPRGRELWHALDRRLRSDGNALNPGTTADLVTACLFLALLRGTLSPADRFPWQEL